MLSPVGNTGKIPLGSFYSRKRASVQRLSAGTTGSLLYVDEERAEKQNSGELPWGLQRPLQRRSQGGDMISRWFPACARGHQSKTQIRNSALPLPLFNARREMSDQGVLGFL